jgi:hypothetical protein
MELIIINPSVRPSVPTWDALTSCIGREGRPDEGVEPVHCPLAIRTVTHGHGTLDCHGHAHSLESVGKVHRNEVYQRIHDRLFGGGFGWLLSNTLRLPYYDVCDTSFNKEVSPALEAIYIEYCTWFHVFCVPYHDWSRHFTTTRAPKRRHIRNRILSLSEMFLPAHRTE